MNEYSQPHKNARATLRQSMQDALARRHSYTNGRLPRAWQYMQRDADIETLFNTFENKGLVRIDQQPDDLTFDDLHGDCYDESHADTIPGGMRELNKQRKEAERRVEAEGQWYIETAFIDVGMDGWHADHDISGIGAFVGDDFYGSGYESELYLSAIEGLFESRYSVMPPYIRSKTGAWHNAVLMAWEMVK